MWLVLFFLFAFCSPTLLAKPNHLDDSYMHPHPPTNPKAFIPTNPLENGAAFWNQNAQATLDAILKKTPNTNVAKNVILFLGDGMSIPTVSATRVYIGGEEQQLSFDKFPNTALSKTYCVDHQVADSACSATAYLGGVKANMGTIGVTGDVPLSDCPTMLNTTNHVDSIATWSQAKGKRTGLVTGARITHASPGGVYAHTADRNWEYDVPVALAGFDPAKCHDIAYQFVNYDTASKLNVALGGGRSNFYPIEHVDELGNKGWRADGQNLVEDWLQKRGNSQQSAQFIWNRDQLNNVDNSTDYLLGLFNIDHMEYNLARNKSLEPSLEEMTEAAIKILSKGDEGYFLFVEGAKIDMGHHDAKARRALDEAAEFSKAIQRAVDLTNEEDTLIVVTSDHAHTMNYAGYAVRNNDILGLNGGVNGDGTPYATLGYANGPGYKANNADGSRYDISHDDFTDQNYQYPGINPVPVETHGGDDVGIFARGPWSHLYSGVIEQNVIPHIMAYASCVGDGITACKN